MKKNRIILIICFLVIIFSLYSWHYSYHKNKIFDKGNGANYIYQISHGKGVDVEYPKYENKIKDSVEFEKVIHVVGDIYILWVRGKQYKYALVYSIKNLNEILLVYDYAIG